jgi:hypothetical protein
MSEMNYEKMWYNLKSFILKRNSHGKNELRDEMERLEIEESRRKELR